MAAVVVDRQRRVLEQITHPTVVLAERVAGVEVIGRVATLVFRQPPEQQTQAAAAVTVAQVGQVWSSFRTSAHNEHQAAR
tara:strand:- start:148 stop:387 length:240 start_codon:yes stop_codon:yes gene_type:complete